MLPILTYGAEIWGYGDNVIIDRVQRKFCKMLLKVKNTTPTCMVYGELGRLSVDYEIQRKCISYWLKIKNMDKFKYSKIMYELMSVMKIEAGYTFKWLDFIENLLQKCEFENINDNIVNTKKFKVEIEKKLKTAHIQEWNRDINSLSKCINYRIFKRKFGFENYLLSIPDNLKIPYTKFRTGNHSFPIEVGRYVKPKIESNLRICSVCNILGDEYHYLFECLNFHEGRCLYLPTEYHYGCNAEKYYKLFNTKKRSEITNLAKFIKIILKKFKDFGF